MNTCDFQASGDIEQYFYGELTGTARARVEAHVAGCGSCRGLLDELGVIRSALSTLPDVASPPQGDWSRFMARLDAAVQRPARVDVSDVAGRGRQATSTSARWHAPVGYLAVAAMLALITISIVAVLRDRDRAAALREAQLATRIAPATAPASVPPARLPAAGDSDDSTLAALTEQHFERSKLVVLGLATKDPAHASAADWTYERQLASSLLDDTRLYRLAAEAHGMEAVAGVMRDLELVLLQTSLGESSDPATLAQIQRLIRKRDLVTKMNVLTTGL